jgi:hypothetical protein
MNEENMKKQEKLVNLINSRSNNGVKIQAYSEPEKKEEDDELPWDVKTTPTFKFDSDNYYIIKHPSRDHIFTYKKGDTLKHLIIMLVVMDKLLNINLPPSRLVHFKKINIDQKLDDVLKESSDRVVYCFNHKFYILPN